MISLKQVPRPTDRVLRPGIVCICIEKFDLEIELGRVETFPVCILKTSLEARGLANTEGMKQVLELRER